MGIEKLRGLTPDQKAFDDVLNVALESKKSDPGLTIDCIAAEILGTVGSEGVRNVHEILSKKLGGIPEGMSLIPVPNNSLFRELTEEEGKTCGIDFAGVILASLAPVVEKAEKTSEFDPEIYLSGYRRYVQGTCAFRSSAPGRAAVTKEQVRLYRKAGMIYTVRGLPKLHPYLSHYLESIGVLDPLLEIAGPAHASLVKSLRPILEAEKVREIAATKQMPGDSYFGRDKVDAVILNFGRMWVEAQKREQEEQK